MSEPVSNNDVHEISQDYKKLWKEILHFLLAKIREAGKYTNNEITVKVGKADVYKSVIGKQATQDDLSEDIIKQIHLAFQEPEKLKGSVSIFIGNEVVFHAKDGKVVKDSLSLVYDQKQNEIPKIINLKLDATPREDQGKIIARQAREMLAYLGELNETDGSVNFESANYLFTVKDNLLSVNAKDWRGEVLNDNGFTKIVTNKDIESLQKIESELEKLQLQHFPLQVTGLKHSV
jgi:hypothetical protein